MAQCSCFFSSETSPADNPGGANDPVNEKGMEYYSNLIDALLAEGIQPVVTLFHWDLPSSLEERYGGFDKPELLVPDFVAYAQLIFERFGDRVKNWITINEPFIYTLLQSAVLKKEEHAADNGKEFDNLWAA
jgi:beta-glucosidase